MSERARLAVLASGSGTNLQAILDACQQGQLQAEVVCVASDHQQAFALQRATRAGVDPIYHPWAPYRQAGKTRRMYDADLASKLEVHRPNLVVLAGWMRLLSMAFLERFPMRVINLHPALPGTFPGTEAISRAWQAYQQGSLQQTGVMVHFVPDEGVDDGPVIALQVVEIRSSDTLQSLEERIHQVEHRLIVEAIAKTLTTLGAGNGSQERHAPRDWPPSLPS